MIENVDLEIDRIYHKLGEETETLAQMGQEYAIMHVGYKLAYAQAFIEADGKNREERDAKALLATGAMLQEFEKAEQDYKNKRELLFSLRAQLSSLQTMSANVRGIA